MSPAAQRWVMGGTLAIALVAALLLLLGRGRPAGPRLPVIAEVGEFRLVDQDGRPVTAADLAGRPWIVDFVFTRCRTVCPLMTRAMSSLRESWPAGRPVRFVSISVDPEHDRPEVLRRYRAEQGVEGDDWLFLTGGREEIHALVQRRFLLVVDADPPAGAASEEMPILHSSRFVLVDGQGRIRGYYDAFDGAELERLQRDARRVR